MKYNSKFTVVVIAAVASLLLAGTILVPTQSYARKGSFTDHSTLRDGLSGDIRADLANTDQNINQENICFRSDICRQSDVGQNTLGNDNQVTGFADQSDNIQNQATTPQPPQPPKPVACTTITIPAGTTINVTSSTGATVAPVDLFKDETLPCDLGKSLLLSIHAGASPIDVDITIAPRPSTGICPENSVPATGNNGAPFCVSFQARGMGV
jgi:hypothetical protein